MAACLPAQVIPPPILKPIVEGTTLIEGQATGCPGGTATTHAKAGGMQLLAKAELADGEKGLIRIDLASPPKVDTEVVVVYELKCPHYPDPLAASNKVKVGHDKQSWIELTAPIRETQSSIAGKTGDSVTKVRVFVINPNGYNAIPDFIDAKFPETSSKRTEIQARLKTEQRKQQQDKEQRKKKQKPGEQSVTQSVQSQLASAATDQDIDRARCLEGELHEPPIDVKVDQNTFKATPAMGLEAGQCVVVQEFTPNGEPGASRIAEVEFVRPAYVDWGRLRGTFTAGAAIGQSNGSFTQADPYLSFYLEGSLWQHLLKNRRALELGKAGIGLHFFGEGRLSQTAVALPGLTDPIKASNEQRQSIWFQSGIYVPLRFIGWDWSRNGQIYSFVSGPLAKYGASFVNDGVVVKQVDTILPAEPTLFRGNLAREKKADETKIKQALPLYGGGARFGFYRYALLGKQIRNRQILPELLGYVDYTYGQDTALRTPFDAGSAIIKTQTVNGVAYNVTEATTGYRTDQRHMVEARFKMPGLPFLLGMDASFGTRRPDSVPSVLRFIIATRLDAATALGKIFSKK